MTVEQCDQTFPPPAVWLLERPANGIGPFRPATLTWLTALALLALVTGCTGVPAPGEQQARQAAAALAGAYRPPGQKPKLTPPSPKSGLAELLRFAMLNQPAVEAAYFDWLASVERITVSRSLPDPRLTFETDITRIVQTIMPGLMMDFPVLAKLSARGQASSAESQSKYFAFELAVLKAANGLKRAYYQLQFLEEKIRVERKALELAADLEEIARRQNEVGKVTAQDVLRAQIEEDRVRNEIANLDDSRKPLLAAFKAALGLGKTDPDPSPPLHFEMSPADIDVDKILATAFSRNPRIGAMEADVRRAEALIRAARRERWPDVSVGLEADALAAPTMYRPGFSLTLPIWRDKIAAQIADAQATKGAAEARLSAEEIRLAAELAEKSFMVRQAGRNLTLARDVVGPKTRESLEVARSSYLASKTEFFNLIDTWRTVLNVEIEALEAQTERELALADLSLLVAGLPPRDAPVLPTTSPTKPDLPKKPKAPKVTHGTKR
ncbi:MAG TPA: TolC family protein [Verrucomicrobiae bacterium]|nr:TolC family protein [Verrucomicrobiae bacterium]